LSYLSGIFSWVFSRLSLLRSLFRYGGGGFIWTAEIPGAELTARSVLHETRLKKITSCCMLQRANVHDLFSCILGLEEGGRDDAEVRAIVLYGGGGFIWTAEIPGKKGLGKSAAHMYFACGLGVLIVLCRDSTFVRFSIKGAELTARSVLHETRLKKITSCCMLQRANVHESVLLIGTVSGNVFALDINSLELSEYIVFEDCLLQR
ncbi:hypothetical protein COOONC_03183, partial [Cooperia oncophora]